MLIYLVSGDDVADIKDDYTSRDVDVTALTKGNKRGGDSKTASALSSTDDVGARYT